RGLASYPSETRRPRRPLDPPVDRGRLHRFRRRCSDLRTTTPPRVSAMGGGVSLLRRLRFGRARGRDRNPALLPDPGGLSGQPAQEVQLGAPHTTLAQQPDLGDQRRMEREDSLDAHARRNLPNGERLVDAAAAPGNADALERLQPLLLTLADAHHDAHRIAGREGWDV